ncbi:class I SAM-dependent methyltransferase [Chloroflexota bacterium]
MFTKINLLDHHRKLWFYAFHRFEGNNYQLLGEYLSQILTLDIEEFMPLHNKKVLDVGGGRGIYCKMLSEKRNCAAVNLDLHPGEYIWPKTIIGSADNLPFKDNEFNVVICRGVLEHIPTEMQQQSLNEMARVTKMEGLLYIAIPPWYNPHAGHGLKPFHILPFKLAKFLRELIFRNRIEADSFEEQGLYGITFKGMLKMISASDMLKVVATKDVHLRLHFLTRVPVAREIMVPGVAFILVKG